MPIQITVNGQVRDVDAEPDTPLLTVLRNDLGLKGTRFGCGEGTCGACMVTVDGRPVQSCDVPVETAQGKDIRTVEGLADPDRFHRLQQAFIDLQAAQCAYCVSGVLMSACALLEANPSPSRHQIREALDENLCRCGAHWRMIQAVERAAAMEAGGPTPEESSADPTDQEPLVETERVRLMPDGTVVVLPGKVELGQGVVTAFAQIAADELRVPLDRIRMVATDTARSPDEKYTSGSYSIEHGGSAIRRDAATARDRMAALEAEEPSPAPNPAAEPVVGLPIERLDLPAKLLGRPSYVHDLVLPGMLHARVARPPAAGARLRSLDRERVEELPGVVKVVRSGSFVGVLAEREEQAARALRRIEQEAVWDVPGAGPPLDRNSLALTEGQIQVAVDGPGADEGAIAAEYTRPFLAHASIGPSCAVAVVEDDTLTVWSHTQGVHPLRAELARVLGMPDDRVRVIHREGAGCYGHNGADDVALDAALMALAVPGRPVRVQWTRADEFGWEPYGSAMVMRLAATLTDDGSISSWSHDVWSHSHLTRPGAVDGVSLLAAQHLEEPWPSPGLRDQAYPPGGPLRNAVSQYDIPGQRVTSHFVPESPVRVSALRSLGSHANVFAIESFMDELAGAAGTDPVTFRLRHLTDPRAREVIEAVVERAGVPVGGQNELGHGFGLGFARYKNSGCYTAVIAEVAAEHDVRCIRAWAAVDAGLVINPDGVKNQIEGGMIQSASWALKEQAKLDGDRNGTRSWLDYPILTFTEVPEVDVVIVDRPDEKAVGVGEGAQGPMTAAIANGLAAALGTRVRDLPLTQSNVMRALL